jgi:hypothetical protein
MNARVLDEWEEKTAQFSLSPQSVTESRYLPCAGYTYVCFCVLALSALYVRCGSLPA